VGQVPMGTTWRRAKGRDWAEAKRRGPTATRQLLQGPATERAPALARAQSPALRPGLRQQAAPVGRSGCDPARMMHEIGRDRARARQPARPPPEPATQWPVLPVAAVIAASALAARPLALRSHRSVASPRRSRLRAWPAQVAAAEAVRPPGRRRRRSSRHACASAAHADKRGDRRRAPRRSPHAHRRVASSGSAGADLATRTICTNSARWP
jgi:hypothetical protein